MFAQESGMDLQKEREAFEKECRLLCYKGNMVMSNLGSFYNNEQTNWMWQMWLSAKAQAVPEGFVLVDKHQLAQLMANMDGFGKKALGDDYVSFADIAAVLDEAQEQSHECPNP